MDNQTTKLEPENQIPLNQEPAILEPELISQSQPPATEQIPEPIPAPEPIPEPVNQSKGYQQILDQYAASQPQPPIAETPVETPPVPQMAEPTPKSASQTNIFKIIFTIALILFIIVFAALAFTYFKNQQDNSNNTTGSVSPTPVSSATCSLNDITYSAGDSFPSADGCNTCSCLESKEIVCTEKACVPTPTTPVTTKSATKSATIAPTKTITPSATSSSIR